MEPHDYYDGAALVAPLNPKPYYLPQVMTPMVSDLRACIVGGAYTVGQQRLVARPSSVSCSPNTSPKLQDLSPSPVIQETPGRLQPPDLYPPSGSSSPADSQPSTPTGAPFPQTPVMTPPRVDPQEPHKPAERGQASLQEDDGRPAVAVSIKEEPQELDQMYLDDGEIPVSLEPSDPAGNKLHYSII